MLNVNTVAKYKVVTNKKLNTVRVLVAFNVGERFLQKNCEYVSGDVTMQDVERVLADARKVLRTNNIVQG